jgi:Ion channel
MTTVGYGDIFPVTTGGRIFTIMACIIGTFVVSLIISQLTALIALEPDQEAAYDEIMNEQKRKGNKEILDRRAKFFVKFKFAKIRKLNKKVGYQELFERQVPYQKFREQIEYNNE